MARGMSIAALSFFLSLALSPGFAQTLPGGKPNPKSSGVIVGHHFTRSAGISAHAWTSCKRHHACDHQSARTRCRCARQHARIFRRGNAVYPECLAVHP